MKRLFFCVMLFVGAIFADPAPLGLELGKANVDEFFAKFGNSARSGDKIAPYENGQQWLVYGDSLGLDDANIAYFLFDDNGILARVEIGFDYPTTTDNLRQSLKKYKYVGKQNSHSLFDSGADIFTDGQSNIYLRSGGFGEPSVIYETKDYAKRLTDHLSKQATQKQNRQNNAL